MQHLNEIDSTAIEGQMLVMAIGRLMTYPDYMHMHPDEILQQLFKQAEEVYKK